MQTNFTTAQLADSHMAASESIRATAAVFQPLSAPLLALTKSVKASFDPRGILNFGRMVEGV